jgi:S-DNA-T family DNA segregation ATPase FtsK/SpoIIIE
MPKARACFAARSFRRPSSRDDASVSLLQRALGIGYGRAARLIDFMAEDGIVGAYNGSNAREVLYTPEDWHAFKDDGRTAARA